MDIRATAEERGRSFPGDALLDEAVATWTHGVTIAAPPRRVWPWLAQMGAGRAGWYSWDFIDNRGHRSADEVVAEWQRLALGDVLLFAPGAADGFVVEGLEPGRDLVLGVRHEGGGLRASWEFLLDPLPGERTRLLVRVRVGRRAWARANGSTHPAGDRSSRAVARMPVLALFRAAHRVMQARQLRGIRRRAEA